jgi:hypothetical protein
MLISLSSSLQFDFMSVVRELESSPHPRSWWGRNAGVLAGAGFFFR